MAQYLNLNRDSAGNTAYAPSQANIIYTATLGAATETHITVPKGASQWLVAFSYEPGSAVWVNTVGGTAAVPAGGTLAAATSELNPAARLVKTLQNDGTANTVSMITAAASIDVSVMFYAI